MEHPYRLIIIRTSLWFTLLSKNLADFPTQQNVEFSFKCFDERDFLKIIKNRSQG